MVARSLTGTALRIRNQIAPVGRPLASFCLAIGYGAFALGLVAPDVLNVALRIIPDALTLPIAYLVSFVYPAAYAVLSLKAAYGAVVERSGGHNWTRRDHIHVYLAIAFAEWTVHHLLYLLFPLALLWGYLTLSMGVAYAVPVWGMLCIAAVGVLVGNRYMWYHDPDSLPPGAVGLKNNFDGDAAG